MSHRANQIRPAAGAGFGRRAIGAVMSLSGGAVRLAIRRPAIALASVALVGGGGVFAWNATMEQRGRHPAPLFAGQKPATAKVEAKTEARRAEPASPLTTGTTRADTPVPPARPAGPDAIGSIIRTSETPAKPAEPKKPAEVKKQAEVKKPVEAKKPDEAKKSADAKKPAEAKKPSDSKPVATDSKSASQPRVASAQKALAKLGYGPIQADGLFGAGTRAALERFERDKKLPVTGELNARTAKQLASLSGITVE